MDAEIPCCRDLRQRDVLPLPALPPLSSGSSKFLRESISAKRNRVRFEENRRLANEVISSVNEMAGFRDPSGVPPTKAQAASHDVLLRSIARMPRPAVHTPMREAIHELLHLCPSSPYQGAEEGTQSTVRAYDRDLLSLPECGADPLDAVGLIDPQGREILEHFKTTMLASDSAAGEYFEKGPRVKPFMDPKLRNNPQEYALFVKDMFARGMVGFRPAAGCVITPFFVAKKSGKLRLVLDCRASNKLFAKPPDIALAAGYTFAQLELPTAQSDIRDYFYSIGLPPGLRPSFCLPRVRSADLGGLLSGELAGHEWVFPQMKVVPMGWSWSMWVAQRIHQHIAASSIQCPPSQVLVDGRPAPDLSSRRPVLIPYADNLNVCGVG